MKTHRASPKLHTVQVQVGWETMLADVETEIGNTKRKVTELEQSAKILQQKIKSGEPFPKSLGGR
jgi:hypothetical protein